MASEDPIREFATDRMALAARQIQSGRARAAVLEFLHALRSMSSEVGAAIFRDVERSHRAAGIERACSEPRTIRADLADCDRPPPAPACDLRVHVPGDAAPELLYWISQWFPRATSLCAMLNDNPYERGIGAEEMYRRVYRASDSPNLWLSFFIQECDIRVGSKRLAGIGRLDGPCENVGPNSPPFDLYDEGAEKWYRAHPSLGRVAALAILPHPLLTCAYDDRPFRGF